MEINTYYLGLSLSEGTFFDFPYGCFIYFIFLLCLTADTAKAWGRYYFAGCLQDSYTP